MSEPTTGIYSTPEDWSRLLDYLEVNAPADVDDVIAVLEVRAHRAEKRAAATPDELDVEPEVMAWFHESVEQCEHDYPDRRDWPCSISADHFLRAFTVQPRLREVGAGRSPIDAATLERAMADVGAYRRVEHPDGDYTMVPRTTGEFAQLIAARLSESTGSEEGR